VREDAHGERGSGGVGNDGGSEGDALGRRSERRGVDDERDSEKEEKRVCWIGFFTTSNLNLPIQGNLPILLDML
jgi:hypothetical protein